MESKYRYLIPNGITFLSLTCGVVSIMLSATGELFAAGILILASYVLDLLDGASARRFAAGSEFGLQLDSLVDMVSLGAAPTILVFMHLRSEGLDMALVWPFSVFLALAGAFRLARFNLLPAKESGNTDSVGLTISTAGTTVALAVLSDLAWTGEIVPDIAFIPLLAFLAFLMASKISFPSALWVIENRRRKAVVFVVLGSTLLILPLIHAWFIWLNAYLGLSLARAGYKSLR